MMAPRETVHVAAPDGENTATRQPNRKRERARVLGEAMLQKFTNYRCPTAESDLSRFQRSTRTRGSGVEGGGYGGEDDGEGCSKLERSN